MADNMNTQAEEIHGGSVKIADDVIVCIAALRRTWKASRVWQAILQAT